MCSMNDDLVDKRLLECVLDGPVAFATIVYRFGAERGVSENYLMGRLRRLAALGLVTEGPGLTFLRSGSETRNEN
jgi:hypothetical protein